MAEAHRDSERQAGSGLVLLAHGDVIRIGAEVGRRNDVGLFAVSGQAQQKAGEAVASADDARQAGQAFVKAQTAGGVSSLEGVDLVTAVTVGNHQAVLAAPDGETVRQLVVSPGAPVLWIGAAHPDVWIQQERRERQCAGAAQAKLARVVRLPLFAGPVDFTVRGEAERVDGLRRLGEHVLQAAAHRAVFSIWRRRIGGGRQPGRGSVQAFRVVHVDRDAVPCPDTMIDLSDHAVGVVGFGGDKEVVIAEEWAGRSIGRRVVVQRP